MTFSDARVRVLDRQPRGHLALLEVDASVFVTAPSAESALPEEPGALVEAVWAQLGNGAVHCQTGAFGTGPTGGSLHHCSNPR